MLFSKKIDKMVALEYIGPYILSFMIAEFVLVMQFLWKYIDLLTGKGLTFLEISKLVFLFGVTIIPKAIPITILLASVFVFGNMSEKFELTSLKSSGMSLLRVMRVGVIFAIFTAIFSLVASNYLVPRSNYMFFKIFYGIKHQKKALFIEPKVFNDDFYGYSIFVDSKDKDNNTVHGVLIYDHSGTSSHNISMVSAETGVMETTNDNNYFIMNLENGVQIRETEEKVDKKTKKKEKKYPLVRTTFEKWKKIFILDEFKLDDSNISLNRRRYDLLNTMQLLSAIDSSSQAILVNKEKAIYNFNKILDFDDDKDIKLDSKSDQTGIDTTKKQKLKNSFSSIKTKKSIIRTKQPAFDQVMLDSLDYVLSFDQTIPKSNRDGIIQSASRSVESRRTQVTSVFHKEQELAKQKSLATMKLHTQYSWAMICIIFLFIGAPLGSIIRKGGYGYPLLLAIIFFMIFIILTIAGERLHRGKSLGPVLAAWLPCILLLPFAIIFTIKAMNDSRMFSSSIFNRIKNIVS